MLKGISNSKFKDLIFLLLKELSLCPKLCFSKPYIFQCRRPQIFQTMNSIRSNNVSLKYQRFATLGSKDYKFRVCDKDSIPFLVNELQLKICIMHVTSNLSKFQFNRYFECVSLKRCLDDKRFFLICNNATKYILLSYLNQIFQKQR